LSSEFWAQDYWLAESRGLCFYSGNFELESIFEAMADHPKVLLSSVFKPFAEADNLYSRVDSKIELLHNQITKYQGVFSPRIHYNTYGLHLIAANLPIPATVLDYPTLPRFIAELKKGYDYVGIGSIGPNFQKVKRMTAEIRKHSPKTKIVLGGFCATLEHLDRILEVDYICVGEGISFMRELLGFSPEFEFKHPDLFAQTREILGLPFFWGEYRPVVIVGLGCPYGCDFCAPSHFFGKKHIKFLKTGEAIVQEMVRLEKLYGKETLCLLGDDNFLADEQRARELREAVLKSGRQFTLRIFGTADLVSQWDPAELAEMGIYNIWIGRESKFAPYAKNRNVDIKQIIAGLHRVGINVILSSILLLDEHTRKNISEDLEDHLACNPDFSQFAFYAPAPGTPFYDRLKQEGRLMLHLPFEDCHEFKQPWFLHPEFSLVQAEQIQKQAYREDYLRLGPSGVRVIAVETEGYQNLKDSPNPLLRTRAEMMRKNFPQYRVVLKASSRLVPSPELKKKTREILEQLETADRKINLFEEMAAWGLVAMAKARELRTRYFGDVLQPKTIVAKYPGAPS